MKNNKFSSYSFWIAVTGAVVIFLKNLLQAFGVHFDSTAFESIVVSICGVLVVFGVITKEDSSRNIEDKTETLEETEFDQTVNALILEKEELESDVSKELEEENKEEE